MNLQTLDVKYLYALGAAAVIAALAITLSMGRSTAGQLLSGGCMYHHTCNSVAMYHHTNPVAMHFHGSPIADTNRDMYHHG